MKAITNKPRLIVVTGALSGSACAIVAVYLSTRWLETALVLLGVAILIVPAVAARGRRWRDPHRWPGLVLLSAIAIYNGSIAIEVAVRWYVAEPTPFVPPAYPRAFTPETLVAAMVTVLVAQCAAAAGGLLGRRHLQDGPRFHEIWRLRGAPILYRFGLALVVLGTVALVVGGIVLGSDTPDLLLDRGARLQDTRVAVLRLGSVVPAVTGVLLMARAYSSARAKLITIATFFIAMTPHLVVGDRRYAMLIVLSGALAIAARSREIRIPVLVSFGALGYIVAALVGRARSPLADAFARTSSVSLSFEEVRALFESSWLWPSTTEFKGPLLSLLMELELDQPLSFGAEYIGNLGSLLPGSLRAALDLQPQSQVFASQVWESNPAFYGQGFGLSPVAEAMSNFGIPGVLLVFASLGFLLERIAARTSARGSIALVVALSVVMLNVTRVGLTDLREGALLIFSGWAVDYYVYRFGTRRQSVSIEAQSDGVTRLNIVAK